MSYLKCNDKMTIEAFHKKKNNPNLWEKNPQQYEVGSICTILQTQINSILELLLLA